MQIYRVGLAMVVILLFALPLRAERSKVLELYGHFEAPQLQGWEKVEGGAEYLLKARDEANGQGLSISARDVKYIASGISINPLVAWDTTRPCIVSLDISGGEGDNDQIGFGLFLRIVAQDKAGQEYKFYYF